MNNRSDMNGLKADQTKAVVPEPVDETYINTTANITNVAETTILRLLSDLGCACITYHAEHVRGLTPHRVQIAVIWPFDHCKANTVAKAKDERAMFGIGRRSTQTASQS